MSWFVDGKRLGPDTPGEEYDCPVCGGRFEVSRITCDVGHVNGCCHGKEVSPPTLADHPKYESTWQTESGLWLSRPGGRL